MSVHFKPNSAIVKSFTITKVGGYKPQFLRPLKIDKDENVLSTCASIAWVYLNSPSGEDNLSGLSKSDVLSAGISEIAPMALHAGDAAEEIKIPSGWSAPRWVFVMEVEFQFGVPAMYTRTETITGYTDGDFEPGVKSIESLCAFNINDIKIEDDRGNHRDFFVTSRHEQPESKLVGGIRVMTSMQVFDKIELLLMEEAECLIYDPSVFIDTTGIIDERPRLIPREHNLAKKYLADLITVSEEACDSPGTYDRSISLAHSCEKTTRDSCFMTTVADVKGSHVSKFTFADLLKAFPPTGVSADIKVHNTVFHDDLGADWNNDSDMTKIAYAISRSLPVMMSEKGLSTSLFVFSRNHNVLSYFTQRQPLEFDRQAFADELRLLLDQAVLRPENVFDVIDVKCCAHKDVIISFYKDGKEIGFYVAPLFCDALLTPMLTRKQADVKELATGVRLLLNRIAG